MNNPTLRMLVVDGKRHIRRFIYTLLSNAFTILKAENGRAVL